MGTDQRIGSRRSSVYPAATSAAVSAVMKGNRRTDTRPELRLRSALHRRGLRFRKDFPLTGTSGRVIKPDVVFTGARVAVFVDGCFWHACPLHGRVPGGRNAEYWALKMERNRMRDERQNAELCSMGWRVVRIWEHVPVDEAVATVLAALEDIRRVRCPSSQP